MPRIYFSLLINFILITGVLLTLKANALTVVPPDEKDPQLTQSSIGGDLWVHTDHKGTEKYYIRPAGTQPADQWLLNKKFSNSNLIQVHLTDHLVVVTTSTKGTSEIKISMFSIKGKHLNSYTLNPKHHYKYLIPIHDMDAALIHEYTHDLPQPNHFQTRLLLLRAKGEPLELSRELLPHFNDLHRQSFRKLPNGDWYLCALMTSHLKLIKVSQGQVKLLVNAQHSEDLVRAHSALHINHQGQLIVYRENEFYNPKGERTYQYELGYYDKTGQLKVDLKNQINTPRSRDKVTILSDQHIMHLYFTSKSKSTSTLQLRQKTYQPGQKETKESLKTELKLEALHVQTLLHGWAFSTAGKRYYNLIGTLHNGDHYMLILTEKGKCLHLMQHEHEISPRLIQLGPNKFGYTANNETHAFQVPR